MSLHDFLQSKTKLTGTKQSCAQGGCGTCTVTLARWDEVLGHERYSSVNACLLPLGTLHGAAVTTTEGLGNSQDGFHPVQKRIADYNGSQCGYCTPGPGPPRRGALTRVSGPSPLPAASTGLGGAFVWVRRAL